MLITALKCDIDDDEGTYYNLELISRICAMLEKESRKSTCIKREAAEIKFIKIYLSNERTRIFKGSSFLLSYLKKEGAIFYSKNVLFF